MKRFLRGDNVTSLVIMTFRSGMLVAKFGLTLYLAHFLGLEAVGMYGLIAGATIVGPVVMNFGLLNTLSRESVGHTPSQITVMLRNYWLLILAAYAVVAVSLGLVAPWVALPPMMLMVVAITCLDHINQDISVILTNQHKALAANMLLFIRGSAWIFAFVAASFVLPELRTLPVMLVFWLVGVALPIAVFAFMTRTWPWVKALTSPLEWVWFGRKLKQARRLYVSDLANVGGQYIDRYLISLFLGLELTGVYVLFWQVGNAVYGLVNSGVMQLYRPKLIGAFQKGDDPLYWQLFAACRYKTMQSMMALALPASIAMYIIIPLLNRPLANSYMHILIYIMLGFTLKILADIYFYALYTRKQDMALTLTNLQSVVLGIVFNIMFIPFFGLYGSVGSMVTAYLVVTLTRIRILTR